MLYRKHKYSLKIIDLIFKISLLFLFCFGVVGLFVYANQKLKVSNKIEPDVSTVLDLDNKAMLKLNDPHVGYSKIGLVNYLVDSYVNFTKEQVQQVVQKLEHSRGISWDEQALKQAENYVYRMKPGISRNCLVDQLALEKFTKDQIDLAVQKIESLKKVDWNEQALKCAEIAINSFVGYSKIKLIEKLVDEEKFTKDQVDLVVQKLENYGKVNWNEEALKHSKKILFSLMGHSKQCLIEKLVVNCGFEKQQASWAVKKLEDERKVDWNEEALKNIEWSLKSLLTHNKKVPSKESLIEKLVKKERFTEEQALCAVRKFEKENKVLK